MRLKEARRGEFAARPRQRLYPMWGMEDPYRETNIGDLYRYNEVGLMTRYIIPPSDVIDKRRAKEGRKLLGNTAYKLLKPGFAVEDLAIALVVAFSIIITTYAIGPGMDACIDALGW